MKRFMACADMVVCRQDVARVVVWAECGVWCLKVIAYTYNDSAGMRKRHAWPPHQLVINTDREDGDRHGTALEGVVVFEIVVKYENQKNENQYN